MSASSSPIPSPSSLADASLVLERVGACFDAGTRRLAGLCARGGKLDAKRLDEHQWSSYQLALADADLLAAREVVSPGGRTGGVSGSQ